jgi:ABC-2 type transport system permease protein
MNSKIWLVVQREYREHVTKKAFWIGLLLGPLFFAGLITLQVLSATMSPDEEKKLAVVDRSGRIATAFAERLSNEKFKNGKPEFVIEMVPPAADSTGQYSSLNKQVAARELYGYLVFGDSLEAKGNYRFYTRNIGNEPVRDKLNAAVGEALIGARLKDQQIALTKAQLEKITQGIRLDTFKVTKEGEAEKKSLVGTIIAAVVLILLLSMTILSYGVTALRSILEEKSSRIIEVLLSSMSPFQLLMGKILGACLVGLTQVGFYVVSGALFSTYSLASAPPGLMKEVMSSFTPVLLLYFLVYFLLGFFLFLSIFAAVGSMVNSEQEAHSMQTPVMFALIIPIYATFFFINNPDSTLARVVSFIPIFTPMVMMMRISILTPPFWEIALSIVLTLATIIGVIWIVSRIFRVGILMYGKRPNLPEIVRWVRTG